MLVRKQYLFQNHLNLHNARHLASVLPSVQRRRSTQVTLRRDQRMPRADCLTRTFGFYREMGVVQSDRSTLAAVVRIEKRA